MTKSKTKISDTKIRMLKVYLTSICALLITTTGLVETKGVPKIRLSKTRQNKNKQQQKLY